MKRKLFISAGHTNVPGQDNGATGIGGILEGNLTVELRDLIVARLKTKGVYTSTDNDSFLLYQTIMIEQAVLDKEDLGIDIHFNASDNPTARGTEAFVAMEHTFFEITLGEIIVSKIAKKLNTINRGVNLENKTHVGRLGFLRPNCENILIEICFITNKDDVTAYNENKEEVATIIADCIYNSLEIPTL